MPIIGRKRWELVLVLDPLLDLRFGLQGILNHTVCGVPAGLNIIFNKFVFPPIRLAY